MVGKDRTRITISPRKEILERIDEFSRETGMSRSDVIQFMVIKGFESYDAVKNLPADILAKLAEQIK